MDCHARDLARNDGMRGFSSSRWSDPSETEIGLFLEVTEHFSHLPVKWNNLLYSSTSK